MEERKAFTYDVSEVFTHPCKPLMLEACIIVLTFLLIKSGFVSNPHDTTRWSESSVERGVYLSLQLRLHHGTMDSLRIHVLVTVAVSLCICFY